MKGTYTLILFCKEPFKTQIGSLGHVSVGKGHYLYTGSALGNGSVSLEGRLNRHLRVSKKVSWHIDYLTSDPRCRIKAIVCLKSGRRLECVINQEIVSKLAAKPVTMHAGASDCKCDGHLTRVGLSLGAREITATMANMYRRFGRAVYCMQLANHAHKAASSLRLVRVTEAEIS